MELMLEYTQNEYPEFRPNQTPEQMFNKGIFHCQGGYFRTIYSVPCVEGEYTKYEDRYKRYTKNGRCLENVEITKLITPSDKIMKSLNFYKVKAGTKLADWLESDWIMPQHPYGWLEWYCDFYDGKRCDDDSRQIKRWINFAGAKKGRWRKTLINKIKAKDSTYDDILISPVIRQSLLHWAYELTQEHFMV
jgi:hypothetical protein